MSEHGTAAPTDAVARAPERTALLRGILWVAAGVALFAVTDAAGKKLSETQSVVQIVWSRYLFSVPVLVFALISARGTVSLRTERPGLQTLRALMPMLASFSVVGGLALMPLAEVTALTFASPLLVVALSGLVLGERTSRHDWIGVLVGFVGILVIVRPGTAAFTWAALFPLGCAFCFSLYQLGTRLVGRSDSQLATLCWTVGVGFVVSTALLAVEWRPLTPFAWVVMAISGLSFGTAQLFLIRAFSAAPPAILTAFTYTQIVPALILGLVVFGTVPDLVAVIGTCIVIAAGLWVLRHRVG